MSCPPFSRQLGGLRLRDKFVLTWDHFALNLDKESGNSNYNLYVLNDYLELDYINKQQSTPRSACSNNNTAPFDGVVAVSNGQFICNPTTHVLHSDFTGMKNSQIFKAAIPHIGNRDQNSGWREMYAQAFAYEAYANTLSSSQFFWILETADAVFQKGYFGCVRLGWAADLLELQSATGGCTDSIPGWWTPQP